MLQAIAPSPTRDELVYASLRKAIVEGNLAPGQEVVASTVAVQLGVSRIPVMHACQRLVGEGFLVANPRRSVTVAPITEERIIEGNEVLVALECLALEHVATHATEANLAHWEKLNEAVREYRRPPGSFEMNGADYAFHSTLWDAAGKPYLSQQLRLVYDHHEPARALARIYHDASTSSGQHARILEALHRKDLASAHAAIQAHRKLGTERAIVALQQRRAEHRATQERTRRGSR